MTETLRTYGIYVGFPNGKPEDISKCIKEVIIGDGGMYNSKQCGFKRGKGKDGLYCGVHAKRQRTTRRVARRRVV